MMTADAAIEAFLSGGGDADERRRLAAAALFARSMLRELRSAVEEWEATAATIQRVREARNLRQGSASLAAPPFPGAAA
jgi:hypothetical protein